MEQSPNVEIVWGRALGMSDATNLEIIKRRYLLDKTEENGKSLVIECMRHRLVSERTVRHCAGLGDQICSQIFPGELKVKAKDFLSDRSKKLCVEISVWCAEKVISDWILTFPHDNTPQQAILAAKQWLKNPVRANIKKAKKAIRALERHSGRVHPFSLYHEDFSSVNEKAYASRAAAMSAARAVRADWVVYAETSLYLVAKSQRKSQEDLLIECLLRNRLK